MGSDDKNIPAGVQDIATDLQQPGAVTGRRAAPARPPSARRPTAPRPPRPPRPPKPGAPKRRASPPPPPPPAAEDDDLDNEKTGAMSLEAMQAAGLLDPEPPPPEDDGDGSTRMMEAVDMANLPGEPPPVSPPPPPEPPSPPAAPEEDEAPEGATMMMDALSDPALVGGDAPAEDEEPPDGATMMLDSPVAGLEAEPEPEPEPTPLPRLVVEAGNDAGREFEIAAETLVGRGLDCDIVLTDASVSRKHFRLLVDGDRVILKDLGSGNGTKLNGQRIAHNTELVDGALISVGVTQLRWHDERTAGAAAPAQDADDERTMALDAVGYAATAPEPEEDERTRVGGMAAVEELEDWRPRQGRAGGAAPEPQAAPTAGGGGLKLVLITLVSLVVLGGGFLAVDKIAHLGILFPAGGEPEAKPTADRDEGDEASGEGVEDDAKARAKELVAAGVELIRQRKWYEARGKFKRAKRADPDNAAAKAGMERVKAELRAWRAMEEAERAVEDKDFSTALASLKKVDDTSTYYTDALELKRQALDGLVATALTEARAMDDAGKGAAALEVITKALKLAPQDADLLAMREELRGDGAEPQAGTPATPAAVAAAQPAGTAPQAFVNPRNPGQIIAAAPPAQPRAGAKPTAAAAQPAATAPRKAPKPRTTHRGSSSRGARKSAKISAVLAKYASGDFTGAAAAAKSIASGGGPRKVRQRAKRMAAAIPSFQAAYSAGMSAAKAFKATAAIGKLKKARKIDARIGGSYQGKIKATLAKMYAYQANSYYAAGKLGRAGGAARKALALQPGLSAASRIYNEVQGKAQTWLDQAKAAANSNPAKAMALLQKVVSVFPRTDPRYKAAFELLNQLAAQDEE